MGIPVFTREIARIFFSFASANSWTASLVMTKFVYAMTFSSMVTYLGSICPEGQITSVASSLYLFVIWFPKLRHAFHSNAHLDIVCSFALPLFSNGSENQQWAAKFVVLKGVSANRFIISDGRQSILSLWKMINYRFFEWMGKVPDHLVKEDSNSKLRLFKANCNVAWEFIRSCWRGRKL